MRRFNRLLCVVVLAGSVSLYGQSSTEILDEPELVLRDDDYLPEESDVHFGPGGGASVGIFAGLVDNLCSVGGAIVEGGVAPLNGDSLASAAGFRNLLMSDSDLMFLANASQETGSDFLQVVEDYQAGGMMTGIDAGGYLMYDFNKWLNLPLFVRGGFNYAGKIAGGAQKVVLGSGVDVIAAAGGSDWPIPAGGYEGGTMEAAWGGSWMEIPLSVGVTFGDDRGKFYAGLGGSWYRGGFSVAVKMDEKYAAFITAYEAPNKEYQVVSDVEEEIRFTSYGVSAHMFMGMEAFVKGNWAFTAEYWSGGFANTVYAETLFSETAGEVMTTALGGPAVRSLDKNYIARFAYPVVLSTVTIKVGVKYYYGSLVTSIFQKDAVKEVYDDE